MVPLPGNLLTKMSIDADMVRRMHEDNPFFRARAERYAQLDTAIRDMEAQAEAATTARKYLIMLKKRREDILLELVDLIVKVTPAAQEPLWKVPPGSRGQPVTLAAPIRSWSWP
jgi:uncharacterized protein YdcH (DUF465 family)